MRRATIAITVASVCLTVGVSALGVVAPVSAVGEAADTSGIVRAARKSPDAPVLDPATRRIIVVGDSILFSRFAAGARTNQIVPLALDALRRRAPRISVTNRAAPGLSTLHTIDPRATTVRPYLEQLLDAGEPPPDVVVVAVSSIDINLFPDISVAELAPALIRELDAVERMLAERGVDTVFVPPFGINGDLYNELRSRFEPFRDYRFGERVDEYHALLRASGLPLLFDRFAHLDGDGDGNADRRYFTDNDPLGQWPDDGIHPNALGERVFGDSLANGLVAALERG